MKYVNKLQQNKIDMMQDNIEKALKLAITHENSGRKGAADKMMQWALKIEMELEAYLASIK